MRAHNGLSKLDTSALSASPRRLTEGVLEVEGPTSAGVASCLPLDTEPVFRRLRDDLFDGKILVGIIRRGGNELQKGSVGNLSKLWGFRGADSQLELYGRKTEEQTRAVGQRLNGKASEWSQWARKRNENFQQQKTFAK